MDGGQLLNKQKTLFVETTKREEGLKQDPVCFIRCRVIKKEILRIKKLALAS